MYVKVFGSRTSSATSAMAPNTTRLSFCGPLVVGSNCIVPNRSEIVLGMECLPVAVGAHLLTAREAYQLSFRLQAVDGTFQLGRAVQALAVPYLADANTRRREHDEDPIKKGAARRDQRDEEHPFHDDRTHWSCLTPARLARQRLSHTTVPAGKGFP